MTVAATREMKNLVQEYNTKPVQTALYSFHSAINLHVPMSEASSRPHHLESMLIAQESSNPSGPSSPVRPHSFAQDLTLPSPIPSLARLVAVDISHYALILYQLTSTRVLEMGTSFKCKCTIWKAQAVCSLQSSKRTQSLSQFWLQSVGHVCVQLKDAGGVEFLVTRTLLGNQFAAPFIHACTPSNSMQTQT